MNSIEVDPRNQEPREPVAERVDDDCLAYVTRLIDAQDGGEEDPAPPRDAPSR